MNEDSYEGLIFLAPEHASPQALHQALSRGVDVQMTCVDLPDGFDLYEDGRYRAVGMVTRDETGVHAWRREGDVRDFLLLCMGADLVAKGGGPEAGLLVVNGSVMQVWVVLVPQTGDLKWAEDQMRA